MEQSTNYIEKNEEVGFWQLLGCLFDHKIKIISSIILGLLLSIIYLNLVVHKYVVTLRVSPTTIAQSNSTSLGQFSSFLNIDKNQNADEFSFIYYIESIHSYELAEELYQDQELLKLAFEGKWDKGSQSWKEKFGLMPFLSNLVRTVVGAPTINSAPPSVNDLQEFLSKKIRIKEGSDSPIIDLKLSVRNPDFGRKLLLSLHHAVDRKLLRRMQRKTQDRIRYLHKRFESSSIAEVRKVLIENLYEQEKLLMTIDSDKAFIGEVFDGPIVPKLPTEPKISLVLVFGALLGFFIGVVYILLKYLRKW